MQWLVGWENDLPFIQIQRVKGGVDESYAKISEPDRSTYSDARVARRRLFVLLAGAATTDDPAAQHNRSDFDKACIVLVFLFQQPINWKPESGIAVDEQRPNSLLQKANDTCKATDRHPLIRKAIDVVAEQLLAADCDADGRCRLCIDVVVEICLRECGTIQTHNEWLTWIAAYP